MRVPAQPQSLVGIAKRSASAPRFGAARRVQAERLQHAAIGNDVPKANELVVQSALRSPGQSLDAPALQMMRGRFGHDFGQVRVHAEGEAGASARALGARAHTLGDPIVFSDGHYAPGTASGRRLPTPVVQQSAGTARALPHPASGGSLVQRDTVGDIRHEAELPSSQRSQGRLGQLETQARTEADASFQRRTGAQQLPAGATGRATQIVDHVALQVAQLENARARGYQDAVAAIVGQATLNADRSSSFWLAFAGNTLWALSGLVPLLGPVVGVSRIALAAGGGVLLRTNALGTFLTAKGGALATTLVGITGAEMAQFSGGTPSGSSLPSTLTAIQATFTGINARLMSRYRTEGFALTLETLNSFDRYIAPENRATPTADYLENLVKGLMMGTLFAQLDAGGLLDRSNYTIDTARAQALARDDLLREYVLRFGAIRDQRFSSTDVLENRVGAEGADSALRALGGAPAFAQSLAGPYELVVGNLIGTLADWGAESTLSPERERAWRTTNALSTGIPAVEIRITNRARFAEQLSGTDYEPTSRATRTLRDHGATWQPNVIPSTGMAEINSANLRSLSVGGRTIYGLERLTVAFIPHGQFSQTFPRRSTTVPDLIDGTEQRQYAFTSGTPESVSIHVDDDVAG